MDPGLWIQDLGSRTLDPGPWIQDLGSRTLDPELDPGPWIQNQIQDPGSRILDLGSCGWEAVFFLEAVFPGGVFFGLWQPGSF